MTMKKQHVLIACIFCPWLMSLSVGCWTKKPAQVMNKLPIPDFEPELTAESISQELDNLEAQTDIEHTHNHAAHQSITLAMLLSHKNNTNPDFVKAVTAMKKYETVHDK